MSQRKAIYPLNTSELGIYLDHPETTAYNLPFFLPLWEGVDLAKLQAALAKVFALHPHLFMRVCVDDEGNVGKYIEECPIDLPVLQAEGLEGYESKPFEVLDAPLFRLAVYEIKGAKYLLAEFHHLVIDGTGIGVFFQDLVDVYEGKKVSPETCSCEEYTEREKEARFSKDYEEGKAYYAKTFGGLECSSVLPYDKQEAAPAYRRIEGKLTLTNSALHPFVKGKKVKTSAFFLSVYSYLLAKMNMDKEALVATVHNGRDESVKRSIGMFVKTLPFYARFQDDTTIDEFLTAGNDQLVAGVANDLYSYVDVTRDLGLSIEQIFGYQGDMYQVERKGEPLPLYNPPLQDGMGNSTFVIFREGDAFRYELDYRADLYEEATMAHLAKLFDVAAGEFLTKRTLGEIDLLTPDEAATLDSFNRVDEELMGIQKTVVDGFYANLSSDPEHLCVVYEDKQYTYAQVDDVSNRIANQLIEWGIGREDVVSVLISKCEYTVIASLGALKACAAYQPLDPSYPPERLNFMIKDASVKAIILDRSLEHIIEGYQGHRLYLDEIASLPDNARPKDMPRPNDLFVMLYTSGTTGLPKGVQIEHHNVATLAAMYNKYFEGAPSMRAASYASYGFDAHIADIYPTITAGGTVYVIPEKMRLDLVTLGEYYNSVGITHALVTTQVGRQMVEELQLTTVKHFLTGGEKLVPVEPPKGFVFHNAYGPTEGTVFCSEQPVDKLYLRVPIGPKGPCFKAYIVDENMRLLPWGVKGELCIAGPQVARGYLNRDPETKKAFVSNPFDEDPNFAKMYKTGDVVKMLSDGTLDFIGRNDGQVKIRGFRVELTEVEQIIRQYPGIKDVTVKDFADPSGIKYIVAYVVSDEQVDVDGLNAFIGRNKPPYMIPAFTMQIDKIPLNQNQKVNKRALPQPELKAKEMVPPQGEVEQKIFDILKAILGHESFGVTTDFGEAGLSSVTAIKFSIQLSKAFGKSLKTNDLGDHNTVRSLAAFLGDVKEDKVHALQKEYPLTKLQEGIFVECTTRPGTTVYNIPLLLKLDPSVDLDRLEQAVCKVVDAHPYLKMRLGTNEVGDVIALRDDARRIEVERVESWKPVGGVSGLVRPFDLSKDDLFRAAIVTDEEDHYLFLDGHHILFDGESLVVLMRDLEDAYAGKPIPLETYTGYEVALDEAERVKGEAYPKAKAYYEDLLGAVDVECMPIRDRDEGNDRGEEFSLQAPVDEQALSKFLSDCGTVNALWNTAFGYTLAKFLAREDCVYTTVYNGRSDTRLADAVGMYVHTLPVVLRMQAEDKGKDAVRRIARQLTDNMANDVYPFAEISRNLGVKANVMFVYEGDIGESLTVGGKPAESVKLKLNALKADLSFFVFKTPDGFRLDCEYNARYYEEWSIRSLASSVIAAFNALVRNETLTDISLLGPDQKAVIEASFVGHEVEDTDVVTLFERAANAHPECNAVIFRDKHISYAELDRLTDKLAAHIQSIGVGKEDVVSILVPRGEYMVIAALGALKSGAAYEPLDPSYPPERLNFMVRNAGAKLVIADRELMPLLSEYDGERLFLDEIDSLPDAKPADPKHKGSDLFIVLYTSGTTGVPKGVMLEHHNLVNFCAWYRSHYDLDHTSVVGAYASFGFDADMMDLYPALTSGAAVFIIPEDMRLDLAALDQAFEANRVSHVFMTTQMGRMFAENMQGPSLQHLSVGGETLAPVTPPKGFKLWNGYGPTECTIFSTVHPIDRLYFRNPIGGGLWNYRLYVVGKSGEELPVGALGELWIAGAGVGRGYLDLPEQTRKVFIPNPFDASPAFARVYRTGDVVRRLADGSIDFVGRNDGQVKIRGFRIELSEVENVIREYPSITNATVQAFDDTAFGGKFLAAYVVANGKVDFGKLGEFIKSKKPPYMVPAAFMQLDQIPLNQNQKVNKRALPAPVRSATETQAKNEPTTELEREICKVFAGILGLDEVGATDDFFALGGTSISAAKVVMFATNHHYPVAYKDVFDNPTPRALARHINSVGEDDGKPEAAPQEEEVKEEALRYNVVAHVDEIADVRPLGRTLLTGATGFLGSHLLKELLRNKVETVVLCRGTKALDARTRLSAIMAYYFDEPIDDEASITVVDGDITNDDLLEKLKDEHIDTIINSAACVKHFAADDTIEKINVGGVENMIKVAQAHGARFIQISTLSVAGENVDGKFPPTFKMNESQLYFGQDLSNKYAGSKFGGEKAVVEAIGQGLDGKCIRVGNLMGRHSDGEFQINSITNAFIKSLRAYEALGAFPVSACDATVDFSPIDEVAKAVVTLARTDSKYTIFHVANSHEIQMADVIAEMNRNGFRIDVVSDKDFSDRLGEFMQDNNRSMLVSSLLTYASSDHHVHTFIKSDNTFSIKALYRLGYRWPITDGAYLTRVIVGLRSLGFFERSDI